MAAHRSKTTPPPTSTPPRVESPADATITESADGRISGWSRGAQELFGYLPDEVLGRPTSLIVPQDLGDEAALINDCIKRLKRIERLATTRLHKDGGRRQVVLSVRPLTDAKGKLTGALTEINDVSDLWQARSAIDHLFRLSPNLLGICGFDGFIKRLNPAWSALLGHPESVFREHYFLHLVHPDDHERTGAAFARAVRGESITPFENRLRCADGGYRSILWQTSIMPESRIIYVSGIDITERSAAQKRQELLFQNSLDAVLLSTTEGQILQANPAACRLFGWSEAEILSGGQALIANPDDERWPAAIEERRINGHFRGLLGFRHRDGAIIECSVSSQSFVDPAGMVCNSLIIRDITDQLQASEDLHKSEEKFYKAFHSSPNPMLITQLESSLIVSVNQAFEHLSKYHHSELIGHQIGEFQAIDPSERARFASLLARDGQIVGEEFTHIDRLGRRHTVLVSAVNVEIDQEAHAITTFADVTEQRAASRLVLQSLAEKETLLRELYHRTKNNMAMICGLLDLQDHQIGDPRLHAAFLDIQNRIRSQALVHEKLYQANDLSRINLGEYIRDLVDLISQSYGVAMDRLELVLSLGEVGVLIDTALPLGLVLNELLSNIMKYSFPAGQPGKIYLGLTKDEAGVIQVTIGDNGAGLPPGLDLRTRGGMGTRIVYDIVERQLRGQADVRTDQGVKWTIRFVDNLHNPRV